jgi:esterase/lipase superfamily enzyme/tetratricopeptide (TPR) repeat protein
MLAARIELRGEELFCADTAEGGLSTIRSLLPETLARLRGWAETYDKVVRSRDMHGLASIGRDIAGFLDEGDRWLDRVLRGIGEIVLDIVVPGRPEERERILLDIPWELLAPNGFFLAADQERLFRVTRRLGGEAMPAAPAYRDLSLLFMAAEVEGQGVLNYEQEEAGILQATKTLSLNLSVEESGAIGFLGERLAQDGPFEALHLSCHGGIDKGNPILALERPAGGLDRVGIEKLSEALGEEDKKPGLVFLSACRTGEHGAASAFVQSLVRSGVANAVGWDGSVNDTDAIGFAETFYEELARGSSVAYAAARARADPSHGQHWHLARVYAGPRGGGALCATGRPRRVIRHNIGFKEFLDIRQKRVPVASAAEFVGRRRQAQRILRAFRDNEAAGVLIHGIGNQGKSSLAARVANRMPGHEPVVVFGRYDALAVFEALQAALPPRQLGEFDQAWRQRVTSTPSALRTALIDMLEGPFRAADPATRAKPVLLIIDDLERMLETPQPGETRTPVKTAYAEVLAAVIAAFRDAETQSQLLLTSRYTFALSDSRGDDLADRLVNVHLPPMDETQRDKQMRAAELIAVPGPTGAGMVSDERATSESRIKSAAGGNPGLQAILSRPLLAGETEAAQRAVTAVEHYLTSGDVPREASAAAEFFEQVSLTAFRDMLTADETQQLRAATLFMLPVPHAVLVAAGRAGLVAQPERAIGRLQGLGLIDLYSTPGAADELAVNRLAAPLVPRLTEAEATRLAEAAVAPLYSAWKSPDGWLPADMRGREAARLALLGNAPPEIINAAALAGAAFLFDRAFDAHQALDLVHAAVTALDRAGAEPNLHLLRVGAECAERLGKADIQEALLEHGLQIVDADPRARAMLLFARASRLISAGEVDKAEQLLNEAAETFASLEDARSRAVTMGRIADILQARGQLDEALKICTEDELPVYERLGDARSRAVTMGKIADILQARGQLDEALKIRTEEQLPVYERLGDVHERAVTMGRIADILQARGQLDEALKIRNEDELPVYERLGDVCSRAVTMGKIADILKARGQLDEALKIRTEEVLPAFERLGAPRLVAVERGKIADILQARGRLDEALKIRTEEVPPAFERLGDVRSRAVTLGRIADILQARGQLDEALSYRMQEAPIYERLGAARDLLIAQVEQAITRLHRGADGDRDEARRLLYKARDEARRLKLPEVVQIEQFIEQASFDAPPPGAASSSEPPGSEPPLEAVSPGPLLGPSHPVLDALPGEPPVLPRAGPFRSVPLVYRGTEGAPEIATAPEADKAEYVVWYGTNRRPVDPRDAGKGYSGMRDAQGVVHYGSCRVFIPKSHKIGSIGSPWWKRLLTLTDDRLRLLAIDEMQHEAYWAALASQLAAVDAAERHALILVHGYNVSFEAAALRAAQIGFDLSVRGAMAFFSWPSRGALDGYSADEATIEASEGAIADFMTDFAQRSGAAAVHIIAHSMGNRGVLRAVNRIAATAQQRTGKPFGQIILAAADVDADVFRQLAKAYGEVSSRTTLYVSKRDLAVEASRWLHDFARAGLMPPTLVLPGIDTINVTDVDLTMLGHGYIADARAVLTDMHALITRGAPPDQRFGLRPTATDTGERFWLIGG